MAHKQLLFKSAARETVLKGATALVDSVRVTLGSKSKCVLIEKKWGKPIVCNDGVTIAKEVELEDPEEKLGAPHNGGRSGLEDQGIDQQNRNAFFRFVHFGPQILTPLGQRFFGDPIAGKHRSKERLCRTSQDYVIVITYGPLRVVRHHRMPCDLDYRTATRRRVKTTVDRVSAAT